MGFVCRIALSLACAATVAPSAALTQEIEFASYATLQEELVTRIDFENYPKVPSPGRALDGVATFDGAQIAERFRGQFVAQDNGFDTLLDLPDGPLVLVAGAPGENLALEFVYFLSNLLMGMAPPGFPDRYGGGEGAVSILFDRDQSALGFRVASEPKPKNVADPKKGRMQVSFYRRDGGLIDSVEVELEWFLGSYGFQRTGLVEDIAGISITNRDPQGVMIDDVIFDRDLVLGSIFR